MAAPRVKVGRIRLDILRFGQPVGVKDELVRAEEERTVGALDALRPAGVVPRRNKIPAATPRTRVGHVKGKVVRQLRRSRLLKERLTQPLSLALSDHPATPRRDRHGARSPQQFQLNGRTLDTGDPERDPSVVDLVVGKILKERI